MKFNSIEVMSFVEEAIGKDATGLYINEDVVHREISYEDAEILSTLGEMPFIIQPTNDFQVFYGMTKLCIYPCNKKIDWVIKIPITGIYKEYYKDYDEDCFIDKYNENFIKVEQVGTAAGDVCDEEANIYDNYSLQAQEIMAENYYVGTYNGLPIYVQEKVLACESDPAAYFSYFGCQDKDFLSHEIDYLMDVNSDLNDINFAYNLILQFGIAKAIEIYAEFGDLGDMHSGNYGFNREGKVMIFDYAGYDRLYNYEFFVA